MIDGSWIRRGCILCVLLPAAPAAASVGGPDLARPLGWDPSAKEAYFAIDHNVESDVAATIVRLRLTGPDTARCEPLWWSKGSYDDSLYQARLRRLTRRLVPLQEQEETTVPYRVEIVSRDTFRTEWQGPFARYRVRGRFGHREGTVEAITYIDPGVRMIRYYYIRELDVGIGVFSFIGIPFEGGYEVQIPAIVPSKRGTRVLLQWVRE
jgi:hypothetical protein